MQLALCGQEPETALNSALASVNFYLQQQQLTFEYREAQLRKRIDKVQEACKKKLQEVHGGYTAVRRSCMSNWLAIRQSCCTHCGHGLLLHKQQGLYQAMHCVAGSFFN